MRPDDETIERLLHAPLLSDEARLEFKESRARVVARHRAWRANFPSIALLLDTDEDRAQALAGNYATEARETIGVWLAVHDDLASDAGREERAVWVTEFWRAWRLQVFAGDDCARLAAGPRQRFTRIFDELMERFSEEAAAYVRAGGAPRPQPPALASRLWAPFAAGARAIESFFFPTVRR